MGKATFRKARPGETLFGGGKGILIPFSPYEPPKPDPSVVPDVPEDEEESSSKDRGWYTDIGEIDDVIQAYVESEEKKLGRPLTEEEQEEIVKFCSPEEQDDYEEE